MINSPSENDALQRAARAAQAVQSAPSNRAGQWTRYLDALQMFTADPVPLETQGMLVRVAGLVLEAAGVRVPVGSVCEVRSEGQAPVLAEVVGFNGDRAFLMPTGDLHGLASGARVVPRPAPVVPPRFGAENHPWRRSEDRGLHLPMGDGLLGRVVDALGAEQVRGVMLPFRFTAQVSLDDAAKLAKSGYPNLEEFLNGIVPR